MRCKCFFLYYVDRLNPPTRFHLPPSPEGRWTPVRWCPIWKFPDWDEGRAAAARSSGRLAGPAGSTAGRASSGVASHHDAAESRLQTSQQVRFAKCSEKWLDIFPTFHTSIPFSQLRGIWIQGFQEVNVVIGDKGGRHRGLWSKEHLKQRLLTRTVCKHLHHLQRPQRVGHKN